MADSVTGTRRAIRDSSANISRISSPLRAEQSDRSTSSGPVRLPASSFQMDVSRTTSLQFINAARSQSPNSRSASPCPRRSRSICASSASMSSLCASISLPSSNSAASHNPGCATERTVHSGCAASSSNAGCSCGQPIAPTAVTSTPSAHSAFANSGRLPPARTCCARSSMEALLPALAVTCAPNSAIVEKYSTLPSAPLHLTTREMVST